MRRNDRPGYNVNWAMQQKRLTRWEDWHRFALNELGYTHQESVEYAPLRYVSRGPSEAPAIYSLLKVSGVGEFVAARHEGKQATHH